MPCHHSLTLITKKGTNHGKSEPGVLKKSVPLTATVVHYALPSPAPQYIPGLCLLSRFSQAVPFDVEYILAIKFSITHQPNSQPPSPRRGVFTLSASKIPTKILTVLPLPPRHSQIKRPKGRCTKKLNENLGKGKQVKTT